MEFFVASSKFFKFIRGDKNIRKKSRKASKEDMKLLDIKVLKCMDTPRDKVIDNLLKEKNK